jgi:excisionase family DNA binding protein
MNTIRVQLTLTFDEEATKSLAELLAPAIRQAMGLSVSEADQKKAARLQQSKNAMFGGEKPPEDQGSLIDTKEAARLLGFSNRKIWEMYMTGKMPPPIRIGRAVRWSLEALKKWIADGCPAVENRQSEE